MSTATASTRAYAWPLNSSPSLPGRRAAHSLLLRLLPRSIVARTTVSILLLATAVGAIVASAGAWMIHGNEEARLRSQLDDLLATVESTVSIACYVRDSALAHEIGAGLMRNRVLSSVLILTDDGVLYRQDRPGTDPDAAQTLAISRKVHSPFNPAEPVGEIWLYAAESDIEAQAWVYTRFVMLVLACEVLLVALAAAWAVFNFVTRPIRSISDELHRLEVRTGLRLQVPSGNQQDEIGRLVVDVNALIAELSNLLDTERRLRLEREASERRLALIFEKVDAGLFEIDGQGLLQSWNPAFVRTLGEPPEPASLPAMMGAQAPRLLELIAGSLARAAPVEADFELQADDAGVCRWVELSLTPVDTRWLQGVINDISARKLAEQAAQRLALSDALTGLLNRRGLDLGLKAAFERRRSEPGLVIALLQIDLDWFKQVNDRYGHDAGDLVLRRVAAVLEGAVRRSDLVARPGGDEFTVALLDIGDLAAATAIAAALVESLSRPIALSGGAEARIGVSIGIALAGDDETPAAALRRADGAMYAAKHDGRNTLRVAPAG